MKDLIIIGAGPIGLACGIEAKKNNLDYEIIDKGMLVNSIFNYPVNTTFFSTADKLEIGEIPFISHNVKPTRTEALEYYRRVCDSWKLNLSLYNEVSEILNKNSHFELKTQNGIMNSKKIIICTGFYDIPYLLNIPGEELNKVLHYYNESHPYYKMDVAIVGAGNSAVDVALDTYRKGANSVTMIIRETQIGENIKYWVRPDIINRIESNEINVFYESEILKIKEKTIIIKTKKETKEIKNDFVLAMTGYQPNYNILENLGVEILSDEFKTPVYNEDTMETNVKGVFVAGVICGGLKTNKWFIENSREHSQKILSQIIKV
ncbi:YpdA family putative bacillithiol disulfide reductase [Flavobacteriaceae bacterium]|nr:YpdA family putative bacillithiol disulfide reductase [Flavobacteriaceae bacterium]MDA8704163.1 YpdA family putative bacillithiol disulfide reductase [Flavobacteriaceae bacterium]MDA8934750.1 YpdA family putative bacillithiol disulfide reductase [Flavobacteriaceae bacterium]MDA9041697.1 YpdA family putative bacillithiol disulfide reductase [Flavobacteriaceae bacterium]MDA9083925.1 YpdA family putative bacillithiol disulfide reductase [Flavobacteriaceae bacterium]|tara:strand:+ start:1539 stop:2498 length:960 start_codon:yes stop_codon:yes gene_type:complete